MNEADDPELLCYCVGWSRTQFIDHIRAAPEKDFAGACESSGVGMVCTSCLLNAEVVYSQARQAAPAAAERSPENKGGKLHWPSRGEIAGWLVRHSPLVPGHFESVCPVISGPSLTTELVVSNAIAPPVGARSAAFAVEVELNDSEGKVAARLSGRVAPGETWRADLGTEIGGTSGDDVGCGSARIVLRALDRGYKGTVRPHFAMRARRGSAVVHTANASRNASTPHLFSTRRKDERHFVHIRNCEAREILCRVSTAPLDGGKAVEVRRTLPALGSALVELEPQGAGLHSTQVVCDGLQRTYFLAADADFGRVSVDHV